MLKNILTGNVIIGYVFDKTSISNDREKSTFKLMQVLHFGGEYDSHSNKAFIRGLSLANNSSPEMARLISSRPSVTIFGLFSLPVYTTTGSPTFGASGSCSLYSLFMDSITFRL